MSRRWGLWAVLAFGFLLRFQSYRLDHSFWLDEAFLAVNFQHSTLAELLRPPLEYGHILPGGFLAMSWLSVKLFGLTDQALKLFPFLCGVISLPLFYFVARAYLFQRAVPWAVILFSSSLPLIAYAGEFKQYSTDVAVCLGLMLITARLEGNEKNLRWLAAYALAGILAVWFSLPAVFILAGVGSYVVLSQIAKGRLDGAGRLGVVCLVWAAHWLFIFVVVLGGTHSDVPPGPWAVEFWRVEKGFMPVPFSQAGVAWLMRSALDLFTRVAGLRMRWLAAALFGLGCFAVPHRKRTLVVLLCPMGICALTSYFELYPFSGRVLLFLVPAIVLLVASGISRLPFGSGPAGAAIRLLITGVLIGTTNAAPWQPREEITSCLSRIQAGWMPGDRIYVYHWAEPAFRYYVGRYRIPCEGKLINQVPHYPFVRDIDARRLALGLSPVPLEEATVIWGVGEYLNRGRADLDRLRGCGRVWFLFTHCGKDGLEHDVWANYLDSLGHQIQVDRFPGAALYLYKL